MATTSTRGKMLEFHLSPVDYGRESSQQIYTETLRVLLEGGAQVVESGRTNRAVRHRAKFDVVENPEALMRAATHAAQHVCSVELVTFG